MYYGDIYKKLLKEALIGVMKDILKKAANYGPDGLQHFIITFRRYHPGILIPSEIQHLLSSTHDRITIILQNQFWSLNVQDKQFSVVLDFSGISHKITIPFDAVTLFFDPSVKFGIQFDTIKEVKKDTNKIDDSAEEEDEDEDSSNILHINFFKDSDHNNN